MNDILILMDHLKQCPFDFLRDSIYINPEEGINTEAILLDVLRSIERDYDKEYKTYNSKYYSTLEQNHLQAIHIAAWFYSHHDFQKQRGQTEKILDFLYNDLKEMSNYVPFKQWIEDDERSEEFVRSALLSCGVIPKGETMEEALTALDAVSILKRNNVLAKSKAAYDRIIQIKKKMAEKKAREAANVYGRD